MNARPFLRGAMDVRTKLDTTHEVRDFLHPNSKCSMQRGDAIQDDALSVSIAAHQAVRCHCRLHWRTRRVVLYRKFELLAASARQKWVRPSYQQLSWHQRVRVKVTLSERNSSTMESAGPIQRSTVYSHFQGGHRPSALPDNSPRSSAPNFAGRYPLLDSWTR